MPFLAALLSAFARAIASLLQSLVSGLTGISITDFSPRSGWPGTIITIRGHGFSANRDENEVLIGGVHSLIIDASPDVLVVMAGESTTGGTISVRVGSTTRTAASPFQVQPRPA